MQVMNFNEVQTNLQLIFDSVYIDNEEIIINRKGSENIVLIPFDKYSSIKETNYLLSSSKNREVLMRSLKDARNGKVIISCKYY